MKANTKQEAQCCQDLAVRCARAELERDAAKASEKRPCDMDLEEFKTAAAEQVRLIVDAGKPPSKFPSTMDATVWGAALRRSMQDDGCSKVEGWFQAALSFAYVRGSEETLEKQKLAARPNSVSPLDSFDSRDWAKEFMSRFRGLTGSFIDEELMVGWFANALMRGYDEHRWKLEREAPPAGPTTDERLDRLETEALRTSGRLEVIGNRTIGSDYPGLKRRMDELEARQKAAGEFHCGERLSDMNFVLGRLSDLETRVMGAQAELPMWGRRVEELEKAVRPKPATEQNPLGICGLRAEMFNEWLGVHKRLEKLEARTCP